MTIKSLELNNYRNYESLKIDFCEGTNILYGENAQGKTNILEAIYVSSTTKSHKSTKDKDIISFNEEEGHIRTYIVKNDDTTKVDIHLRNAKSKGIAINNERIRRAADLMGVLNVVFFAPEDLAIIKQGPVERRRFADMELCQLDKVYLDSLNNYNKIVNQRGKLLRDIPFNPSLADTITVWDEQMVTYGSLIIERRKQFANQLNEITRRIHKKLTGFKEELSIYYEPNTTVFDFADKLSQSLEKDIRLKQTTVGPHRDDFSFFVNGVDIRKFGSQGQQRTAALSLKLSELELIKKITNETPVLLLDDVLSELDSNRQNFLLNSIGSIQTIITCTGLDEFVNNRFTIDRIFRVVDGSAILLDEGMD
ncbi:MAG: DNA replication/repair protein RecF [Lachnospiraceae bacterium]|jgi:DNA replication and repair protein RecF|nr:DNA replication/repair protein RecF [Lachnospiraceae bacterium]